MDPREVRRGQIDRLRTLGVAFRELDVGQTRAVVRRFAREFLDPDRSEPWLEAALRAPRRPVAFERFLRDDCVKSLRPAGSLRWLVAEGRDARCHRFERDAWLPALDIFAPSLDESWAASWPGVFVNFEAGRALVVTVDYARLHCDLRRLSPYR
jgi:hypothetical protein